MIKQQWERLPHKTQRFFYFFLWKHTTVTPHRQGIESRGTQGLIHPDNLAQSQTAPLYLSGTDRAHSTVGLALVPDKRSPREE